VSKLSARLGRAGNAALLVLVLLAVVGVFTAILGPTYLNTDNLMNVTRDTAAVTVMAVCCVFVLSSGELDLSFAAVVPVSALVAAKVMESHGVVEAVGAALGVGGVVGLINGLITVVFRIPSFVATLGMLAVLQGLAQLITNTVAVTVSNATFISLFGVNTLGPFPVSLLWSLLFVVFGHVILAHTAVGRAVLATGANVAAARFSGVRTDRVKVGTLVVSGLGGAMAGILYLGQFSAATYTLGTADLLNVLAAVIIGGTAISGGRGSIVGAFIGALLLGAVTNGLILVGLNTPQQLMARGLIIIVAVVFSARSVVFDVTRLRAALGLTRRRLIDGVAG